MARTIELMNTGAAAFAAMAGSGMAAPGQPQKDGETQPRHGTNAKQAPDAGPSGATHAPAGATAAAPAHGAADDGVAECARRLAALEKRVAALEAGAGKGRGGAKGGSRRRRS